MGDAEADPLAQAHGGEDDLSALAVQRAEGDGAAEHESVEGFVQPSEVVAMAKYLGIKPAGEFPLFAIAREAVVAPAEHPWVSSKDPDGSIVYKNVVNGRKSKRHPLDAVFLRMVITKRAALPSPAEQATWMKFRKDSGRDGEDEVWYWYNLEDGSTSDEPQPEVPLLPSDEIPSYDSSTNVGGAGFGYKTMTPKGSPLDISQITELVFTSHWVENDIASATAKHAGAVQHKLIDIFYNSVELRFDINRQMFSVVIDVDGEKTLVHDLVSTGIKSGLPLECWDLHLGARINLLGRTVTLTQCSRPTMIWMEKNKKKLLKIKSGLLDELRKYNTTKLDPALVNDILASAPGKTSLRTTMNQINDLKAALARYRPVKVKRMEAAQIEEAATA